MSEHFVQRVYVVVEAGHPKTPMPMAIMDYETIPDEKHYRDAKAIATALRNLADRFEKGGSFVGNIPLSKEDLALIRNEVS